MNIKKLRQIQQAILKHPKHYDQRLIINPEADCGTVGCFAGWACFIEDKLVRKLSKPYLGMKPVQFFSWRGGMAERARAALDLTDEQAQTLFFSAGPNRFKPLWKSGLRRSRKTPEQLAKLGAARIEHFIKNGGTR